MPNGLGPASVHVEGGAIVRVSAFEDVESGRRLEDAGDAVLLPGLVDTHVHIDEPGRTEWEGFETATRAAAAGGVTTLVDMPLNSLPVTTSVAALEQKALAAEGQCWVDVGFAGGVVPGNAAELPRLARAGALSFKCFLSDSGIDEFPPVAEEHLRAAVAEIAGLGLPLLVHAELPGPIETAGTAIAGLDPRSHGTWLCSRPRAAEDQAVALLLELCREREARIHVVHLSSSSAVELLDRARADSLALTAETCPHYLTFAAEEIPDGGTIYKCAPPIRERENRESLWDALRQGLLDMVVSDHSPCTPELKRLREGDFLAAWGGISSLGLGLPAVWTGARTRGGSIEDVGRWMSSTPARLVGLDADKGAIAPGHDADMVIWDPEAAFDVEAQGLHHRHKVSPWIGCTLSGRVIATYLRGRRIYERGTFLGTPSGRILARGS